MAYHRSDLCALALPYFDRALQALPADAELLFKRGFCRGKIVRYAEAIADYTQVLKLAPEVYPLTLYNLGWN